MSFLKAKGNNGENLLIAVSQIVAVEATKDGTTFTMKSGDVFETTLGFQAVGNRLADLDVQVA